MKRRFRINVTSFDMVGGVHFYGAVYQAGVKVKELDHFRTEDPSYRSIKFGTIQEIIDAAKEWFADSPDVRVGDLLVMWADDWRRRDERVNPDPYYHWRTVDESQS